MEVNVATGGNFFPRKAINQFIIWDHGSVWELKFLARSPIEVVNRAALVDEDFLDCVVFYFNGDDHRVILLVIEALKIVVREGYGGHATSMMRMGYVVDGLDMAKMSLHGRGGGFSTTKTTIYGVDSSAEGAGVTSVRAGWGSGFAGGFRPLSCRGSRGGRRWSERGGWWDQEEWTSFWTKWQKWPARTSSSI